MEPLFPGHSRQDRVGALDLFERRGACRRVMVPGPEPEPAWQARQSLQARVHGVGVCAGKVGAPAALQEQRVA